MPQLIFKAIPNYKSISTDSEWVSSIIENLLKDLLELHSDVGEVLTTNEKNRYKYIIGNMRESKLPDTKQQLSDIIISSVPVSYFKERL